MAVKFFGQFLLEKGVVSREDLLRAIELQDSVNVKFGEMALSMGLITESDIERVHEAQRAEDLRFGDMCVKLGILTEDQLKQVLTKQKNSHIYIGEALIKGGALNEADLPRFLEEFKADQEPYMVDRVTIPEGVPHPDLWEVSADLSYKMFTRIVGLQIRPGPCALVRRLEGNDAVVALGFSGTVSGRFLLTVSSGVRELIAKAMLKEDDVSAEPDEVLNDTVMEFINIICGNIAAKAAQLGKTIDIKPPEVLDIRDRAIDVPDGGTGLSFPVCVADGRTEIGIILDGA